MISIAAREGGSPHPETNYKLRLVVDLAKKSNMPLEKIHKAIDRVFGKNKEAIENVTLEVFGPAGVGLIILALTDNRRRFISEVKNILSKNNGSLGQSGAVIYMFNEVVIIEVESKLTEDDILALSDFGLIDFRFQEGRTLLFGRPEATDKIRQFLLTNKYSLSSENLGFLAKNPIKLSTTDWQKLESLLVKLNDIDDIYAIFHSGAKEEK